MSSASKRVHHRPRRNRSSLRSHHPKHINTLRLLLPWYIEAGLR